MREQNVQRRGGGFTLVELTLVVVIVAVLFFFLMPVLSHSHHPAKARQSSCASNEKQIGVAMLMYVQDYDDRFPPVGVPDHAPGQMSSWGASRRIVESGGKEIWVPGLLSVYVTGGDTFECPEVGRGPAGRLDYLYNDLLAAESVKDVTAPSWTVLLVDGDTLDVNAGHARSGAAPALDGAVNAAGTCDAGRGATVSDGALTRHGGGANYAFADGHVKWFKAEGEAGGVPPVFFPARDSNSSARRLPDGSRIGPLPEQGAFLGGFHAR